VSSFVRFSCRFSKVYPKDGQGDRPRVRLPQVHRQRPKHHRQQLSNTEKIERLAELLNKCA
jgi:hypothetical protein